MLSFAMGGQTTFPSHSLQSPQKKNTHTYISETFHFELKTTQLQPVAFNCCNTYDTIHASIKLPTT